MENFDFGQVIGEGGFASVFKAIDREKHRAVAIKCIDKKKLKEVNLLYRIENEIRIHEKLQHSNIIEAYSSSEDNDNIYIVMELCENGNLFRYLRKRRRLEEIEAVYIIQQIISAIDYLHKSGLVHRDLKLSNILINNIIHPNTSTLSIGKSLSCDNNRSSYFENLQTEPREQGFDLLTEAPTNRADHSTLRCDHLVDTISSSSEFLEVKLCDFGLTIQLQHPDEEHYTLCGTPNYIAPEIVNNEAHGYPADIWSIGALYYALTMGEPLFEQEEARQWLSGGLKIRNQALQRIHETVSETSENVLSKEGKDFLLQIFQTVSYL